MPPELAYFHFLRPAWGLLLIPTALLLWYLWRQPGDQQRFGHIIAPHLLAHLRVGRYRSRWFNPRSLTVVLLLLLAIILMGPSWRQQPSPLQRDDASMVLLLDASASMAQRDVQPSRLERARQKITDLLAQSPDKRAALVVFAGSAHTVLSLTADRDILHQYLDAIDTGIMPRSGKFPEYALPLASEVLSGESGPASIILFSDGVGAGSIPAFETYFAQNPYQLLVVGVGSDRVTDTEAPLERDALVDLADAAGGRYFDLTLDDNDMRAVDRAVGRYYTPVDNDALPWLDSGYPLLFPAMLCFLLWFRKGWTLAWLFLPGMIWLAPVDAARADEAEAPREAAASHWFADLWLTPDQQGRLLMQRGEYREAARRFRNPLWQGLALYYAEDFMQAAEYFSRDDSKAALFNEANARAHARDYLRALARYDRLLARDPDYPGAQANRDRVQALVDEINRLSESQQGEPGEASGELGEDDPRAAEGADEQIWQEVEVEQISAEEVLGDNSVRDMWLRGVQKDPAGFLATKFNMQLQQRDDGGSDAP